jgi:hypothetical protein
MWVVCFFVSYLVLVVMIPVCWSLVLIWRVARPKLSFLYDFLEGAKAFGYNGTMIDGQVAPVNPASPASDAERY